MRDLQASRIDWLKICHMIAAEKFEGAARGLRERRDPIGWGGDAIIPSLVELYQQGRFPFDKLVKFCSLDQINQAAEDGEKGITIKPIVWLGS